MTRWFTVANQLLHLPLPEIVITTIGGCALLIPSIFTLLVEITHNSLPCPYALDMRLTATYGKVCLVWTMLDVGIAHVDFKDISMYSVGMILIMLNSTQWRNFPSFQTQILKHGNWLLRATWQICQHYSIISASLLITKRFSFLEVGTMKRTRSSFIIPKLTQLKVLK